MSLLNGTYIGGKLLGVVAEDWNRNGKSGKNYMVGISRSYTDKWGTPQTENVQININEKSFHKFSQQAAMLKDQEVYLRVFPIAKTGGKNGAWLSYFAPDESDILPQSALSKPVPVRTAS